MKTIITLLEIAYVLIRKKHFQKLFDESIKRQIEQNRLDLNILKRS